MMKEKSSINSEQSLPKRIKAFFFQSPLAFVSLIVFLGIVLLALFAPIITPQNPYSLSSINVVEGGQPPGSQSPKGFTYWLGTDDLGRDILSAIIYGLRISVGVGLFSTALAVIIGMSLGLLAAYFGGWIDTLIMRIVDLQLSFPAVLIALILLAILGRGIDKVIIALVVVKWAYYARTVRGSALVEREQDYIAAARCLALRDRRILFRHLLPNCLPPLIVVATVQVAHAIALEATLSFLGLGVPVTEPSLGMLVANGFEYILHGQYWISFFPGIALLITLASINLIGDRFRDTLNPRLQQ
jgi:peptide/nickel transport system permease protein